MVKRFLTLLLTMLILTGAAAAFSVQAAADLTQTNECPRHEVCTALSQQALAYYTGDCSYEALSSLSGAPNTMTSYIAVQNNALYLRLHTLMEETQTYNTTYSGYKRGSLAYYWTNTDAVESSSTYTMFYSDVMADAEGISLNREHIWPKSRASYNTKNGGADLHHLRPSVSTLNNAKSDHRFGYVVGAYAEGSYKEGTVKDLVCYWLKNDADVFECKDDVKGDVARILLYVYCRWGQPNLYSDVIDDLPALDADDSQNTGKRVIENLDTLLQWCETDPVDSWEMRRNDLTQQVQGNRNVFIDYPELAWRLFGREVPVGMATPTHTGCEHHYTQISCQESTCTKDGGFVLRCENCGNTLERTIVCTGHSDSNRDGICDRCGKPSVKLIRGDADGDGEVTVLDVTRIQRYLVVLTDESRISFKAAQVTEGELSVVDASFILRYLAQMKTPFAIGEAI